MTGLLHPGIELAGEFVERVAVAFEGHEQVIYQVTRLLADGIVFAILAGHDDFAGLLGELFEQLVLDIRE